MDLTTKETIDTVGNCPNCGVEFHIHKEISDNDALLSDILLKSIKLSEVDSFGRRVIILDKLQELITNKILK